MIGEFLDKENNSEHYVAVKALMQTAIQALNKLTDFIDAKKRIDQTALLHESIEKINRYKYCASFNLLACQQYYTEDTKVFLEGICFQIAHIDSEDSLNLVLSQISCLCTQ